MLKEYLGKSVHVVIDRPLGGVHPKHKNIAYELNYGYIPNTIGGDGEEIDAYIMGVSAPLSTFDGVVIAIIHRYNDNEQKLVVARENQVFTREEIARAVDFQEKFFKTSIIM